MSNQVEMADQNVDGPPATNQKKKKGQVTIDDIEEPMMDWKNYFFPEASSKILH